MITRVIRRRIKRTRRFAVYALARLMIATWGLLPLPLALALGRLGGFFAWLFAAPLRRRAIDQMTARLAIDRGEARRRVRALFEHMGLLAAELASARAVRARLDAYVRFPPEDQRRLRDALAEGRGVIGVTAHLGNWELLAERVARAGVPIVTVARRNPNPFLGEWIIRHRKAGGVETIDRGHAGAGIRILRALKKGALLATLIDQDTRVRSVFVPFFGEPARTPAGAAQLALKARTPVIAGFITREPRGHTIRIERISVDGLPEGSEDDRIVALTARMTEAIERAVRASPEQWVWFHERWRTPLPEPGERRPLAEGLE